MSEPCECVLPPEGGEDAEGPKRFWDVTEFRFGALSGLLLIGGLVAGWLGASEQVVLVTQVLALLAGGYTFVPGTLRKLARGRIGVGTLMTIAAAGAVLLGEFGEAAALAFLYSISEGLEEYSLARARHGLRALLSLVPEQARVVRDGSEFTVAAEDLRVGDLMLVGPGERLATDGTVRSGRSSLDVSVITGESVPVEVGPGDQVFSGSINGAGTLDVEVTSTAADNSLARIVHVVEAEQSRRGASQRLADRIAAPMVPGVMILSALIAVVGSILGEPLLWIERALVVLVAASPCALAISVPVTAVAAIGAASRMGVLVKGGAALEALGVVRTVALDKTGTLTRGEPEVVAVISSEGTDPDKVLGLAAALESRSEHPLAQAILTAAGARPMAAQEVVAVPGHGLVGMVDGDEVRLGRPGWLDVGPLGQEVERLQAHGATVVLIELAGEVVGAIAVRDQVRPEAAEAMAQLKEDGYRLAMLTGDNRPTAAAIAAQVGIGEVHSQLLPEQKVEQVRRLRADDPTAMVGDGVNDAPALATADLGIAMGAMGADVAIETADVALMGQDLRHLPQVFRHARRSRRIMLQNVGLSLAIVVVLMPLALFGVLGLAAVVLVHELAEVVVVANGVRAGRVRDKVIGGEPSDRQVERAGM